jgi:hypothetical protein
VLLEGPLAVASVNQMGHGNSDTDHHKHDDNKHAENAHPVAPPNINSYSKNGTAAPSHQICPMRRTHQRTPKCRLTSHDTIFGPHRLSCDADALVVLLLG